MPVPHNVLEVNTILWNFHIFPQVSDYIVPGVIDVWPAELQNKYKFLY